MNKNSMIPLYQQLAEEIKEQIVSGKLMPGERMLTESEFSKKYELSRITVRKAIEYLVDEGYVVRKQGIGTFVADKKLRRVLNNQINSFTEISEQSGGIASADLVSVEWITADGNVIKRLGVEEGSRVLKIVRVRNHDGEPVMIEENYYPETMSFLLQENLTGSTYRVFRDRGIIPSHATKTFDICYATKNEAKLLHVKEHQALLLQKDVVYDQNQEPVHYTKMLINSERYQTTVSM